MDNFDLPPNATSELKLKKTAYVLDLISSIHSTLSNAVEKKEYITHYITKYGFVPLWVLVNDLTFGQLSKFYSLMKQPEKIKVSMYWNNLKYSELESYMKTLSFFRNLCAHDDRIYNARSVYPIPDTEVHKKLSIKKNINDNYQSGKKDFLSLLIVLNALLSKEEITPIINKIYGRIRSLQEKIKCIEIDRITSVMGLTFSINNIKKIKTS